MSTYHRLLDEDPDLTMPVAAIGALVELLAHSRASTISETLDLVERATAHLKQQTANPISLSAGTDLFQRYLINALQRQAVTGGAGGRPAWDLHSIRTYLIKNGRLFVARAKASRDKIADFGRHFVRDGTTVLTNGRSRVVGALLRSAADSRDRSSVRFRVIYVLGGSNGAKGSTTTTATKQNQTSSSSSPEGADIVQTLRRHGVPVAAISEGSVAYAMGIVDMVIVGAEGVVENGGVISRLGTYQIALLARAARTPFYVVAESHKFVRLYPLGQYDLPIDQKVLQFETLPPATTTTTDPPPPPPQQQQQGSAEEDDRKENDIPPPPPPLMNPALSTAVDFTPPDLITALITESGVLTPSAVSEELTRIWF